MSLSTFTSTPPNPIPDQLVELFIQAFTAPPRNEVWTEESAQEFIDRSTRGGMTLVNLDDSEKVVAFLLAQPFAESSLHEDLPDLQPPQPSCYVAVLVVAESLRGQGQGRALLNCCMDKALRNGDKSLLLRCRDDALAMRSVAEHGGMEIAHRYTATVGGATSERLIYQRKLP